MTNMAASGKLLSGLFENVRKTWFAPRQAAFFDPDWYASQYHDVAAAGIDPWLHFHLHGRGEGRLANRRHLALWFSDTEFARVVDELNGSAPALAPRDRAYLAWLVARRLAMDARWEDVIELRGYFDFELQRKGRLPFAHLPALMHADALQKAGRRAEAGRLVDWLKTAYPGNADVALLEANGVRAFAPAEEACDAWLEVINGLYAAEGLQPIAVCPERGISMQALESSRTCRPSAADRVPGPLVSVLMAACNAEDTLEQAIASVLGQTWVNLELIVIDDGSTDDTVARVERAAGQDERVRLLRSAGHKGPYAARNQGLAAARGELITLHDADDWSHPQKIELQVRELIGQPGLVATFTDWVRASGDLVFGTWKMPSSWLGWCHRNTSSFMFRRAVHERLGFWDEVKCNGDVEFVDRVTAVWGATAVRAVLPGVPLAFARLDDGSLTQQSETHVMSSLQGLRHDYALAYSAWHANARRAEDLYLPAGPEPRPFSVPAAILPDQETS